MKNAIANVFRVRLLPSVVACATALLFLKLIAIGAGFDAATSGIQPVYAQAATEDENIEATSAEEAGSQGGEPTAPVEPDPSASLTPEQFDRPSVAERSLLRSLADRRRELDAREREIALQGRLLEASERRVESRIEELKGIETRIEELFGVQEEAQEEQLSSLVTMYQSMKPKDAARILGQLDMDILIQVVRRMSERKMAPILAAMDPIAAQELTVELVTGSGMPEDFDVSAVLQEAPPAP
jgi:flagellar motility protein MotE (MotC chaperone)